MEEFRARARARLIYEEKATKFPGRRKVMGLSTGSLVFSKAFLLLEVGERDLSAKHVVRARALVFPPREIQLFTFARYTRPSF